MNFTCFLCGGELEQRPNEDCENRKCLTCGARHNWDEGFMLSSTWAAEEIKRLQGILLKLRGGIADLQRHVKARSEDDPPMFIPASMCAIIGAMHEAAEAAKEG